MMRMVFLLMLMIMIINSDDEERLIRRRMNKNKKTTKYQIARKHLDVESYGNLEVAGTTEEENEKASSDM